MRLTPAEVESYHENGFIVVQNLVAQREVEWLREIYDDLFANRTGREKGDQFDLGGTDEENQQANLPQILGPSNYAPEMRAGEYLKTASQIAQDLIGPEANFGGDHAILKPAQHGAETPWHQDEAYWDPTLQYESMSIWIPLQDATLENGCMWFVPGSHKLEVLPHHSIRHDPRIHGLEVEGADVSNATPCPIPAGGCTIHHNRTLHYAGPNNTDKPRRALILGFGLPPKKRTEARRFLWNEIKHTARQSRSKQQAE